MKGSHRHKKANRDVAVKHLKIYRQRRDFHVKTAKHYAERYRQILRRRLNVTGMARNQHLAKSIHDASWSAFLGILTTRLQELVIR